MCRSASPQAILQEAAKHTQYWRLRDANNRPPGLLGWMPGHAVTFLDNHDTGSTQNHWPFPLDKVTHLWSLLLTFKSTAGHSRSTR